MFNDNSIGYFSKETASALKSIFQRAKNITEYYEREELKAELLSVLENEDSLYSHWISPSEERHIVVVVNMFFLISLEGIMHMFDSALYYEGDLFFKDIFWMEDDNLVVMEFKNISRKTQKCICHYTDDCDAFTYFTPMM